MFGRPKPRLSLVGPSLVLFFSAALVPTYKNVHPEPRQRSKAPVQETAAPAWRVELRKAIGSDPLGIVVGRGRETKGKPFSAVLFADDDTVVVTFVTREGEPKLSARGTPESYGPLRLRGLFFNAETGELKSTSIWSTESLRSSVVAGHDGNFVTERGSVLTLYDSGKTEQKRFQLPQTAEDGWTPHSSPSGRTLLFTPTGPSASAVPWVLIRVASLEVIRAWQEVQSGWVGISDDAVSMTTCVWIYDCAPRIEVKNFSSEWQSMGIADRKHAPHPVFVNADTLYLTEDPARLVGTSGKVVFEDSRFDPCWWGTPITTGSGQRFAVPACKSRGASTALDFGGYDELIQIRIYDAPFAGLSHQVAIGGPKIAELTHLALSPGGRKVAILNGLSLEVVKLPPLNNK
jgi:hypothetical protein